MSDPIQVSIVIPNYNCLDYLEGCLASIRAQQLTAYEVIVVDDGSTDGSKEWLLDHQRLHSDIRVVLEKGLGPGGARNVGVQVANGEFIAFLDADDRWNPDKLPAQLAAHKANSGLVLSFTDYQHIEESSGKRLINCFDYWPQFKKWLSDKPAQGFHTLDEPALQLLAENVVGTSTVMVRRDAYLHVNGFDTSLPSASDWDLWLKLSQCGEVACTREQQMDYLMRAGSVSSNLEKRLQALVTIAERHAPAPSLQNRIYLKPLYARIAMARRDLSRSRNQWWSTLTFSLQAFKQQPNRRSFVELLMAALPPIMTPA